MGNFIFQLSIVVRNVGFSRVCEVLFLAARFLVSLEGTCTNHVPVFYLVSVLLDVTGRRAECVSRAENHAVRVRGFDQ